MKKTEMELLREFNVFLKARSGFTIGDLLDVYISQDMEKAKSVIAEMKAKGILKGVKEP